MRRVDGHPPAVAQLLVMGLVGLLAGGLFALVGSPRIGPLVGWDAAALSWLVLVWRRLWPLDGEGTARLAGREDPSRAVRDVLLLVACLASLLAVAVVLLYAHSAPPGPRRDAYGGLGVVSVLLSWLVVHTVHTARYARIYYTGPEGGVMFHQRERPRYSDFAYLAFTVGMTFQVSDTNLTSNEMRTTLLRHSLLSYLFGAVIIAATVNLVVGLAG